MTSTLTRTSQVVADWSKVFPCQATETYTSSVTFIKQLTVVAVSTITYLKNAFTEDNYTIDQFGGLKIRVLKDKCDDELAQFLITALKQAFEAFDKKYLHQIALCFYEERCCPENLVEYHLFEYGYGAGAGAGEGASLSVRSGTRGGGEASVTLSAVRARTLQLLRACMVMLPHTQLPETYDVSLRLYYNDDAPEGYQAPGFSAAPDADEVARAARVKLGSVRTPFHSLQLLTHHRDLRARSPEPSESTAVLSQQPAELARAYTPVLCNPMSCIAGSGCSAASGSGGAPAPRRVRCECARHDAQPHMLLCGWCGWWQHAACYGARAGAPPAAHCCVPCAERGAAACADAGLLRVSNRTCFAIFRRALWWVRERPEARVSAGALGGALALGAGSARKLLRVLREHGVLAHDPPNDMESEVDVVPSQLEAALARYFRAPPSPSPASDEAGPPAAASAALSPLEQESLGEYRAALSPLQREPLAPPAPAPRAPPASAEGVRTKRMKKAEDN